MKIFFSLHKPHIAFGSSKYDDDVDDRWQWWWRRWWYINKRPMGHNVHLRKHTLNFVNVFSLFHNYLPLELGKGLNLDHPRMLSAKFGCGPSFEQNWIPFTKGCFVLSWVKIGPVILEKNIFDDFVIVFSLFHKYLPLEKGGANQLNKLEYDSPNDALCQVWLKLAKWFWRRFYQFR